MEGDNPLFLILSLIFGGGTVGMVIREIIGFFNGRAKAESERQAAELAAQETDRARAEKAERAKRVLAEYAAYLRQKWIDAGHDRDDLDAWPKY